MAAQPQQPAPGWPNLTAADFDTLVAVCKRRGQCRQFLQDMASGGLPVEEMHQTNEGVEHGARFILDKAFPGQHNG